MHNYKQHINAKAVVELYHFVMTLQWKAQCCIDQLRKYVTTRWRKRYSTVKPGKMKYYFSDVLHCEEKVVRKRLGLKTSLVWFTLHCINTGKTSIVAILVAQWAKHPYWERENNSFFSLQGLMTRRRRWWNLRTASYRLPCQSSLRYLPSCKTLWRW